MKVSSISSLTSVLLVLCCALSALWYAPVSAINVKLSGINYDFRIGPDWDPNRCKAATQINREVGLLRAITNRIRIYSVSDCNVRPVLREAKRTNMTVWLGVWVSNVTRVFDKEYKILRELVSEDLLSTELLDGVNVGSECLYRNDTTPDVLIQNMKKVKDLLTSKGINAPMSITDTLDQLEEHPEIVKEVDIVTFNVFPFWSKIPIEKAAENLGESIRISNVTKTKPFVITETGWAAGGIDRRASEASPENAARFLNDFYLLATKNNWKYYYFAGFDTPYRKLQEQYKDTVEANFGIYNVKYKMNEHYDNLVINATNTSDGMAEEWNVTRKPKTSVLPSAAMRVNTWIVGAWMGVIVTWVGL